jgi:selenocysteine lyase/cysteine desulfurase
MSVAPLNEDDAQIAGASDVAMSALAFEMPSDVIYLDCAAHGPRLRSVADAARAALCEGALPWRPDWERLQCQTERVRRLAARIFAAPSHESCADQHDDAVALIPSAAYGISIAARNLPLARGTSVLVLDGQFPSNTLPWQQRCAEVGARLAVVERGSHGDWTEAVLATLEADDSIRIAALPQVYWQDGERLDLDRIALRTQALGIALVLDLSQSLGALPVDLARWQPQFAVSVGYKWMLGPPGLAYLWVAPAWRSEGVSIEQHWSARDASEVWSRSPAAVVSYARGARRFGAGGVVDAMRLAMAEAAMQQILAWTIERIAGALQQRTRQVQDALAADARPWRWRAGAAHFIGVTPPPCDAGALADRLRAEGVRLTQRGLTLRIAPYLHLDDLALARAMDRVIAAANAAHA